MLSSELLLMARCRELGVGVASGETTHHTTAVVVVGLGGGCYDVMSRARALVAINRSSGDNAVRRDQVDEHTA